MVNDKPFPRAQELVRNDQRPDGVIARPTARIANHMGVPFGEPGVFGGIKPGVHTGENREMATWRQWQGAFVPKSRGVLGVCRQYFIDDTHRLCLLYRVRGGEDLLRREPGTCLTLCALIPYPSMSMCCQLPVLRVVSVKIGSMVYVYLCDSAVGQLG